MKKFTIILLMTLIFIMTTCVSVNATSSETVEALYMNVKPTFDGVITEDEWGSPTLSAKTSIAASDSKTSSNPYYYCDHNGDATDLNWEGWLCWDEEFFYIGIVVTDPDGHSLPSGEGSLWNGDVIQVRLDSEGANASGDPLNPWSDASIPNMSFGQLTSGELADWDFQNATNITDAKYEVKIDGTKTTYEVAIPHSYVDGKGEENFVYGMAIVVLNAATDEEYNSWLTWGSGICGPQVDDEKSGSNGVKLSKENAIVLPEVIEIEPENDSAEISAPTEDASSDASSAPQTGDNSLMLMIMCIVSLAASIVVLKKSILQNKTS